MNSSRPKPSPLSWLASPEALREIRKEKARRSLFDFTLLTKPDYVTGWFNQVVADALQRFYHDVEAGKQPRLMIFAPPRSGKSELFSRRFPAWALGRNPDLQFISCSYNATLASRTNRDVQRIIDTPAYGAIFPETSLNEKNIVTVSGQYLRNSELFEVVGRAGSYRSAGVGGGITGMGADIVVIDDPVKDAAQAYSETWREAVWEWYTSTLYTRLSPKGGVLLGMTRWHGDDLAGRLLKEMECGEGDKWEIIRFPAIAEVDEPFRKAGDALHPERYPVDRLNKIKANVGSMVWAALYQQRPMPAGGGIFKSAWLQRYEKPLTERGEAYIRVVQSWDTAIKAQQINDPSACITWGERKDGWDILQVLVRRLEYPDLKQLVQKQATDWGPDAILIEDKGSGQQLLQDLRRETKLPIIGILPTADKVVRASACSALVEAGKVALPLNAPWLTDFESELLQFPNAPHDDQVDAFSQFLNWARNQANPGPRIRSF